MSLKPRPEYLRDKVNIDNYLKTTAEIVRNCLELALEVKDQQFYSQMKVYLDLTPLEIYPELHQYIGNNLRKAYEILKKIDMFQTTGNLAKLEECTDDLDLALSNLTGGFFAWIKYLYNCPDGDSRYIRVIREEYPEMYEGLIFEDE